MAPFECNITCKSGEVRTIEYCGIALDGDTVATFVDVTSRVAAKQALRSSQEQLESLVRQRTAELTELARHSAALARASALVVAVPGVGGDERGAPLVTIDAVAPTFDMLASKTRPKKIALLGSDGRTYTYLLKGHEDLRQDERVMQLFGLVASLLAQDEEAKKRGLTIQRYPVIPLSPNSGLIGWVPACDTIHALIRDYRDAHGIQLNLEHRLMLQLAPDYDHLTLLQKMEVFGSALASTSGRDLASVFWLKSRSAEGWCDRRTQYVRSLAVMSMVGYLLGLGDRHSRIGPQDLVVQPRGVQLDHDLATPHPVVDIDQHLEHRARQLAANVDRPGGMQGAVGADVQGQVAERRHLSGVLRQGLGGPVFPPGPQPAAGGQKQGQRHPQHRPAQPGAPHGLRQKIADATGRGAGRGR